MREELFVTAFFIYVCLQRECDLDGGSRPRKNSPSDSRYDPVHLSHIALRLLAVTRNKEVRKVERFYMHGKLDSAGLNIQHIARRANVHAPE